MPTYAQVYRGTHAIYLCSYRTATKNTDFRIIDRTSGMDLNSWSLEGEIQSFVSGVTLVPNAGGVAKVCDLFGAYDGQTGAGHLANRFWGFDAAGNIVFDWDTPNT